MIQFNPPAEINGAQIIDALLDNGIAVETSNDPIAYRNVVPPYLDGNDNFWLAVSETDATQVQTILNSLN